MSEEAIALALGITRPTLAKYFEAELTTGAAVRKMEAMDALCTQAKKGNVTAIKTLLLLRDAAEPSQPPAPQEPAREPAAPAVRLGKKEAAQIAAGSAADGTDWAGLLPTPGRVQ